MAERDSFCGPARTLTCCGAAVGLEGRPQFGEPLQRRPRSHALVSADRHLTLFALVVHKLGGNGDDLVVEQTRPLRPRRTVWRKDRDLVAMETETILNMRQFV